MDVRRKQNSSEQLENKSAGQSVIDFFKNYGKDMIQASKADYASIGSFAAIARHVLVQTYCNPTDDPNIQQHRKRFIVGEMQVGSNQVVRLGGKNTSIPNTPTARNTLGLSKMLNPVNAIYLLIMLPKQALFYGLDKAAATAPRGVISTSARGTVLLLKGLITTAFFVPGMISLLLARTANTISNTVFGSPNITSSVAPQPENLLRVSKKAFQPETKSLPTPGSTAQMASVFGRSDVLMKTPTPALSVRVIPGNADRTPAMSPASHDSTFSPIPDSVSPSLQTNLSRRPNR